ncbi:MULTISPECIES: type II secretion system protein GspM [Pseudomonas]|uniref:type II secretion system protein GspM n=1 Tax=Pseudomonas TaxID=286 RepID=UPI000C083703|nr:MULTISPECIES: type II secretion system protein GspM [Pseudomonas]NNA66015.1 type II secretion system protein M [Pseudomonas gessardii]PHN64055.1 general secretion pathway protein GspM [Pseudomonas sp. ICMP 8385]
MNKFGYQRLRGQLQGFWNGLALREKRLLGGSGALLAGFVVWGLLIEPPLQQIDYWQAETPRLRTQAATLQGVLQGASAGVRAGQDLEGALRQALDTAGLKDRYQLQGVEPAGWRLTFTDAPADAVVGWLLASPRAFSLEVSQARLQRVGDTPENPAGSVSGTVRMDQAPGAKEAS